MLFIKKCREILGKKYEHLSDEQIEGIRKFLYEYADIVREVHKRMSTKDNEDSQWNSNSKRELFIQKG